MAYTKTNWLPRLGTGLNKFAKSAETSTSVVLANTPDAVTQAGTPFSVENMNKIEQGIYDAHQIEAANFNTLNSHADMVDGTGRNLLNVLGVSSIPSAMAALRTLCNGTGTPNFSGLMIGDYLDGINLSAIPAENGGTAGQAWNASYLNNRIVLSGFNTYKQAGDTEVTKNHLLFTFRNIPLKKRMNPANDNTGGYAASEIRAFLEGANGDGTGDYAGATTVTTAAFLNALKAQIGDYILPVRRLLSTRPSSGVNWAWLTCSLFLPSENEILGESAWGDPSYDDGLKVHFPIYQKATTYRCKRYNGARDWHWECSPAVASAADFAYIGAIGLAHSADASAIFGCAPAFCIA
ncbi:MAG: DUF6273 domain-containing protein [Treponema sp.]|jgi:hypothetical protein|nr:DUF6273 domain-containing protein [Treponema sp.]